MHDLAEEANEAAALGFFDALEQAYGSIGRHPAAGSRCCADELKRAGLRAWPLTRHRKVVFDIACQW